MKELPILFSTSMVDAIQKNRKRMTRRTSGLEKMNQLPSEMFLSGEQHTINSTDISFIFKPVLDMLNIGSILIKPRYQKGDHLWVRETYFDTRPFKSVPLFSEGPDFIYRADPDSFIGEHHWKPSLFMPKEAARIWLECTGVRCERLQNISEQDAIDEGVQNYGPFGEFKGSKHPHDHSRFNAYQKASRAFQDIWTDINGPDSWKFNPWIFIYEFIKIENP